MEMILDKPTYITYCDSAAVVQLVECFMSIVIGVGDNQTMAAVCHVFHFVFGMLLSMHMCLCAWMFRLCVFAFMHCHFQA